MGCTSLLIQLLKCYQSTLKKMYIKELLFKGKKTFDTSDINFRIIPTSGYPPDYLWPPASSGK